MEILRRFDTTRLRRERYDRVVTILRLRPSDRVLDVGCGKGARSIAAFNSENEIVGVDLLEEDELEIEQPNFSYLKRDAADLHGIADKSFDVAISFGMLEHIRPRERLVAVIRETQRVARRYCFLVPHKYAFVETHFQLPLFSVWPSPLKAFLIKRCRLGTQERRPDGDWQRINWLTRREWRELFADPNLVIKNHWYGPLLEYYLIFGGELRNGSQAGAGAGAGEADRTPSKELTT
jgi:SAM-dependent methyltransferase